MLPPPMTLRFVWRRAEGEPFPRSSPLSPLADHGRGGEDAAGDPSILAAFRALRLNQGTDDTLQVFLLDAGTWEQIEGHAC